MKTSLKGKSYYKYIILISCFFLMAFPFSIVNGIHSLFITPVTRTLGFSITKFSVLFTISALTASITSPIMGRLLNRFSMKIVMTISSLLTGLGFLSYSFCSRIYDFYIVAIIVAVGMTGLTTIPVSVMLTNWFPKKKGTALGIAFAGISTGTFFFMQIISRLIQNKGYEFAYLLLGSLILIVTLPICIYLVEKEPIAKPGSKKNNSQALPREGKKGLPHDSTFFYFLFALFLLGITVAGTKVHVQPFLDVVGFSSVHNANIGSTTAIVSLFGNLVAGHLFDRTGIKTGVIVYGTIHFLSLLFLIFSGINWISFVFAVSFGLALNLPGLLPSYGTNVLFPKNDYSTTLGITNCIFTIGSSIGPTLTGWFADHRLGYRGAWILYLFLIASYVILLISMMKKRQPQN